MTGVRDTGGEGRGIAPPADGNGGGGVLRKGEAVRNGEAVHKNDAGGPRLVALRPVAEARPALLGESVDGDAVLGRSGRGSGVVGQSTCGTGVTGRSEDRAGTEGRSLRGAGISGHSDTNHGVLGRSEFGNGVTGLAKSDTASGVLGSNEDSGAGVTGFSRHGVGVLGQTEGGAAWQDILAGVVGVSKGSGWGVIGSGTGRKDAKLGESGGVAGWSELGDGVNGRTRHRGAVGVRGVHQGSGAGVHGTGEWGVFGTSASTHWDASGLRGESSGFATAGVKGLAPEGIGVYGLSGGMGVPVKRAGVLGAGAGEGCPGVVGFGRGAPGVEAHGAPVALRTIGTHLAESGEDGGPAGFFAGEVVVAGSLAALAKGFRIDHPLDPENRTLAHGSVDSSEMKTFYDGIVELDGQGRATIELPHWFEALNTDCRYQLTAIGLPAPELHVATMILDNRFTIAGGRPGMRVCWQVTGIRRDAYAKHAPLKVEARKEGAEVGRYLHPESHGAQREASFARALHAEEGDADDARRGPYPAEFE
ncbi:hypothetical protein GXW71_19215 [Roseomonas hellenica]|uniref:Ice nucleation protein n=1 Tax=Plastoroseomonas hellenica TaxID=2687306 RepID=A0ABS5F1R6_9PROT|nr:hypothetical protein [Plastoroseomonas hellenica]MBR0666497.1 hypothetical protein [Plastoroseomonas hellenica]